MTVKMSQAERDLPYSAMLWPADQWRNFDVFVSKGIFSLGVKNGKDQKVVPVIERNVNNLLGDIATMLLRMTMTGWVVLDETNPRMIFIHPGSYPPMNEGIKIEITLKEASRIAAMLLEAKEVAVVQRG